MIIKVSDKERKTLEEIDIIIDLNKDYSEEYVSLSVVAITNCSFDELKFVSRHVTGDGRLSGCFNFWNSFKINRVLRNNKVHLRQHMIKRFVERC